ncbi:hypothetical protein SDC9_28817 [bioreactor metagenome]|uniref:Uncharacterized protein n=1 Tax=bioreactor metagenome TaxID=1076179 RepID=A0A644UUV9_9ZZZZ
MRGPLRGPFLLPSVLRRRVDLAQLVPQPRRFLLERLGIAEIAELAVIDMRALHPPRVLDRAPVFLGPRRHLADIGDDAVAIAAIHAVQLLDAVQIGQVMAVDHHMVAPAHLLDAVNRKADRLVDRDEQIKQREGDHHGVDQRRGQHDERPGAAQEQPQVDPGVPMRLAHTLAKDHPPALEVIAEPVAPPLPLLLDLCLELREARLHLFQRLGHGLLLLCR